MDKVVHFEIPVKDLERAKKFYQDSFEWEINSAPEMDYNIIMTTAVDENMMPKEKGAINGGMMIKKSPITSPVITIGVDNIDEKIEIVKKHGGEIVLEKMKVGEIGFAAYIKDTEDNIIGLWQSLRKM